MNRAHLEYVRHVTINALSSVLKLDGVRGASQLLK